MLKPKLYIWVYTHNMALSAISFLSFHFSTFFPFLSDDKDLLALIYISEFSFLKKLHLFFLGKFYLMINTKKTNTKF